MPHQRRKSGHISANSSATDLRKSVTVSDMSKPKRPAMSRRHTPASAQKLGRSHREREREWQESLEDERESFPQYCMTCEKQFVPSEDRGIYCSESCRRIDQSSGAQAIMPRSYAGSNYPFHSTGSPEFKDIIPPASPSRPTSTHFSSSPSITPGTFACHSSAASSTFHYNNLSGRPPSPPSPTGSGSSHLWPFSGRSATTSPSTSYSRPSAPYLSSTYDTGGYYDLSTGGMDRPLPYRNPGGHDRAKSIQLVTPILGR